jgi:hypothetical protein
MSRTQGGINVAAYVPPDAPVIPGEDKQLDETAKAYLRLMELANQSTVTIYTHSAALENEVEVNEKLSLMYNDVITGKKNYIDTTDAEVYSLAILSGATNQQALELVSLTQKTREQQKTTLSAIEAAKLYKDTMEQLTNSLVNMGTGTALDFFKLLGEASVSGADGARLMADGVANLGQNILNQLPQLLLYAGMQLLGNPTTLPVGIGLIAASGLVAFGAGMGSGAIKFASSGEASTPSVSDITPSKPIPVAALRGIGGTQSKGAAVNVMVNNNASNSSATATESVGPNGERQITVTVENILRSSLASGKMDGIMSRYGVTPQGRRT